MRAVRGLSAVLVLMGMAAAASAQSNLVTDGAFNSMPYSPGWGVGPAPSFNPVSQIYNYYNINSNLTGGLFDQLEPGVNQSGTPNTSQRSPLNELNGGSPAISYSFAQPLQAGTYQYSFDLSSRASYNLVPGAPDSAYDHARVSLFNIDTNTDNVAVLANPRDYEMPYSPANNSPSNFAQFSGTFVVPTTGRYRLIFRVISGTPDRNLDFYVDRVAIVSSRQSHTGHH